MVHWFITVTTYGTWLPGDPRGSVTSVRDRRPEDRPSQSRHVHNVIGTPFEKPLPGLQRKARELMKGPPVRLDREQAEVVLAQFLETSRYRGWSLCAVAIMWNHFHLVVAVPDDVAREKVRNDFKAYASRALNTRYGKPKSEAWWTSEGSVRAVKNQQGFEAVVHYVLHKQPNPLVVWASDPSPQA